MSESLLPLPRQVFTDANGVPLAGGFVHTYVPGGTTPKTTWQDAGGTTPNANPIPLDSAGSCLIYGSGAYQLTVMDADGGSIPGYSGLTQFVAPTAALVTYTAPWANAVQQTLNHRLSQFLLVTDFGALGDATTDNTAAINSAISAATTLGGAIVFFPPGVYAIGGTITLVSNVILQGAGQYATVVRGLTGTTNVMFQTANYATLVGSNTPAGPYKFGLRDMGIDGNNGHRSAGGCVEIYGFAYLIENVEIYNSPGVGFYSEWCLSPDSPPGIMPPNDFPEARIDYLRVFESTSDGFVFAGPHDSLITNLLVYVNGGYGANFTQSATSTSGGTMLTHFHSYGNTGIGLEIGSQLFGSVIESESNLGAGGIQTSGSGQLFASNVLAWGHASGFGIQFNGSNSEVSNLTAFNNAGDGVQVLAGFMSVANVYSYGNGASGVTTNNSSAGSVLVNVRSYGNALFGLAVEANDMICASVFASTNGQGGIIISDGVAGISLSAKLENNTGTQLILNSPGAGNVIDAVIFTAAGQTAYSGTPGNSFYRLATTGADVRPFTQSQT